MRSMWNTHIHTVHTCMLNVQFFYLKFCLFHPLYSLIRAQDTYTSSVDPLSSESLSRYQSEIGAITSTLSNISQELNQLSKGLREQDVAQASSIIEEIQTKEKEKLQLVLYGVIRVKIRKNLFVSYMKLLISLVPRLPCPKDKKRPSGEFTHDSLALLLHDRPNNLHVWDFT